MNVDKTTELKNEIIAKKAEISQTRITSSTTRRMEQDKAKAEKAEASNLLKLERDNKLKTDAELKTKAKLERDTINAEKKANALKAEAARKAEAETKRLEKQELNKVALEAKIQKAQAVIDNRTSKIIALEDKLRSINSNTINITDLELDAQIKINNIDATIQESRTKRLDNIAATEKQISKLNLSLAKKYNEMDNWESKRAEEKVKRQETLKAEIAHKVSLAKKESDYAAKLQSDIEALKATQFKAVQSLNKRIAPTA